MRRNFFLLRSMSSDFEEAFQRADLLADRRLGDFVDLRGLGETLGFSQVAKDFQTLDLHKNTEYDI